jgi:hypothetical protein
MNLLDAARNLARNYPGRLAAMAHRLGKQPDTLRHETSGAPMYKLGIEDAQEMTLFAQEVNQPDALAILNAFAANCGCMVLPMPKVLNLSGAECMRGLSETSREFAELCSAVASSMQDGKISDNELKKIEHETGQLMAALQGLNAAAVSNNKATRQGVGA